MEYHTIYKGPEGETTQWEDIQVKLGNMAPRPKKWKPEKYKPQEEQAKDQAWLDKKDEDELSDLEDEFQDDQALEEYRQKRLAELRSAAARPRFGSVEEISSNEFVAKVTDASEAGWVVCFLYKASHEGCGLLADCLAEVARKYHHTRFVKIVSTAAIPNYSDAHLPTLLVYRDRKVVRHLTGLAQFGGKRATPEQVALVLNACGPVCCDGQEGEGAEEALQARQVKGLVERMVAQRLARDEADESSDFGE